MIPGIDVYSGYGLIDWNLVRSAGYRFAWIKCVEGNEGRDGAYQRNVQRARDAGLAVGAYHFAFPLPNHPAHPNRGPLEQAKLFYDGCSGLGSEAGELSPALDLEWPAPQDWHLWGCTAQQISEWGRECCEAMALLWGRLPVIYTYPSWWRELSRAADTTWAARYPLWFADYQWTKEGTPPDGWEPPHMSWVSKTWGEWVACQHSADGSSVRVPGIPACPVDRDVIRDEETFLRLTGRAHDPDAATQPYPVATPDFDIVHPPVDFIRLPPPDDEPPPHAA